MDDRHNLLEDHFFDLRVPAGQFREKGLPRRPIPVLVAGLVAICDHNLKYITALVVNDLRADVGAGIQAKAEQANVRSARRMQRQRHTLC